MRISPSFIIMLCMFGVLSAATLWYYPKWKMEFTEAAISWDISGYYFYLPAIFIYQDLKKLEFRHAIQEKYHPAGSAYQSYTWDNGNEVMKYPAGMALLYLPGFVTAHMLSVTSGIWPADGFSRPYQLALTINSLLFAFIGLFFTRSNLLSIFDEKTTSWVLVILVLATNYLEYASMTSGMPHNYLFAIYAVVIWLSLGFYRNPSRSRALGIGALTGLAVLTRPTDALIIFIPLLVGITTFPDLHQRCTFLRKHLDHILPAIVLALVIGSIQMVYWKYVSGNFLVYSYEDQGFSWLSPHIMDCLFSYRAGWLLYTPIMALALIGFVPLYFRYRKQFLWVTVFSLLFMYVAFSWDIWWYGGSLGQRSMVQAYAVLCFPLAAIVKVMRERKALFVLLVALVAGSTYYNFWMTHQAHRGKMFRAGEMRKAYFWSIVGRWQPDPDLVLLLDTNERHRGEPGETQVLYTQGFESGQHICDQALSGQGAYCINPANPESPEYTIPWRKDDIDWLRIDALYQAGAKEWDTWKMSQCIIRFYDQDRQLIKERRVRLHRVLYDGQKRRIHFDVQVPDQPVDHVTIGFNNGGNDKELIVDDLRVEGW